MSSPFSPGSVDADGDLGKYKVRPNPNPGNELRYVFRTTPGAIYGVFYTYIAAYEWGVKNDLSGKAEILWTAS